MVLLVVGIQAKHTFLACSQRNSNMVQINVQRITKCTHYIVIKWETNLNGQLGTTTPAGRAIKCSHNPGYYMLYVKDKT